MTPPHSYIPDGSIEAAPYHGYCPPEVRQEPFERGPGGRRDGRLRLPEPAGSATVRPLISC